MDWTWLITESFLVIAYLSDEATSSVLMDSTHFCVTLSSSISSKAAFLFFLSLFLLSLHVGSSNYLVMHNMVLHTPYATQVIVYCSLCAHPYYQTFALDTDACPCDNKSNFTMTPTTGHPNPPSLALWNARKCLTKLFQEQI